MFIIECLTLSKGLNRDSLSYFSSKYIEEGSLVKVSLRGRRVFALVLETREAEPEKADIKSANFQLQKISEVSSSPFLEKGFLEAVSLTAEYFSSTKGAILSHLLPSYVLENAGLFAPEKHKGKESTTKTTKDEHLILQNEGEERFMHYKSLIREEFAKNKSIFICFSKNEEVEYAKEKLERGIESFVSILHGNMKDDDLKRELKNVSATKHPLLILGTSRWVHVQRDDLGTIVIENENDGSWNSISRPFFDLRFFIEKLAEKKNLKLIMGDLYLRTETLFRFKQGELGEFESVKWRLPKKTENIVSDLKEMQKEKANSGSDFKTISPELKRLIIDTKEKKLNLFIFAARRGISSVTICRDCGEQVRCGNCSSPMILYNTKSMSVFKCHQCGETRDANEICRYCKSWKLSAYGAGIDKVGNEIKNDFPDMPIFEINKDVTSTALRAKQTVNKFYETKGSILLGTEMAIPYLYKKIANSAIASFDPLFSIPDFHIKEKIFRLILQINALAKEKFILQSRNAKDDIVSLAISGNLLDFYKKEIEDRQSLNYPPFGVFIKITVRGTKSFVTKESEMFKDISKNIENLSGSKPAIFPSMHEKKGEQAALNLVIKLEKKSWPTRLASESVAGWPNQEILKILRSLPPHLEIKVDPDSLL